MEGHGGRLKGASHECAMFLPWWRSMVLRVLRVNPCQRSATRRLLTTLLAVTLGLGGCAEHLVPQGPAVTPPRETADAFVMEDGTRLPYRAWMPDGSEPWAVVLALPPTGSRCSHLISAASATPRCAATGLGRGLWWTMHAPWCVCCTGDIRMRG